MICSISIPDNEMSDQWLAWQVLLTSVYLGYSPAVVCQISEGKCLQYNINFLTGKYLQTCGVWVQQCPPVWPHQVAASCLSYLSSGSFLTKLWGIFSYIYVASVINTTVFTWDYRQICIILYNHCSFPHDKIIGSIINTIPVTISQGRNILISIQYII